MNGKRNDRDGKKTYYYYGCNARFSNHVCDMKNVRTEVVDNYVLAVMADKIIMENVYKIVSATDEDRTAYVEQYNKDKSIIEKQIRDCEKAIEGLFDLVKSGLLSDTIKERTIHDLNREQSKKEDLENRLKALMRDFSCSVTKSVDYQQLLEQWMKFDFSNLNVEHLREFLDLWIERVVYYDDNHIDIYLKFDKDKMEFDENYKSMIAARLRQMKRNKIQNAFLHKMESMKEGVANLANGIISGFSENWQYSNTFLSLRIFW